MRHFLLCVDRSALSERALPSALKVARYWDATLTLLHVLAPQAHTPGHGATDALDWEITRKDADDYLSQLAAQGAQAGVTVKTRLAEGQPAERIIHDAQALGVDLLILSSHGGGGHLDWCVGTTAQMIASNSPTSLLIIPAELPATPEILGAKCVLVALDGSPRAECAVPVAAHIARSADVELLLVQVATPVEITFPTTLSNEDKAAVAHLQRRGERLADEYLHRLQSQLVTQNTRARAVLRTDVNVAEALAEVARREDVGLMVVSAHGSTGSGTSPHGGVVAKCLLKPMPAPYLIVQDVSCHARAWLKPNPGLHTAPARIPDLYREEQE
ncbi:universal stress protein [Planctomycetota bacterium]|jgi:nucleotide-binding universal stress UspA family protein|nr:universal stress protein [Planctomycetota bacterium]MDA8620666.1 universal stress protein [Planctomycetota bacterium]MDC0585083.1 universal stress protein [Planctomycetota bacterium]